MVDFLHGVVAVVGGGTHVSLIFFRSNITGRMNEWGFRGMMARSVCGMFYPAYFLLHSEMRQISRKCYEGKLREGGRRVCVSGRGWIQELCVPYIGSDAMNVLEPK